VDFASIESTGFRELGSTGFRPEYFSVRKAADLSPATPQARELVILTAARIGKARLIDNVQVTRG
jgi:pantoate--beta-alanine ligase